MPKLPADVAIEPLWLEAALFKSKKDASYLARELGVAAGSVWRWRQEPAEGEPSTLSRAYWFACLLVLDLPRGWQPSPDEIAEARSRREAEAKKRREAAARREATRAFDDVEEPTTGHSRVAVSSDEGSPA
jgi:hypothetical protein